MQMTIYFLCCIYINPYANVVLLIIRLIYILFKKLNKANKEYYIHITFLAITNNSITMLQTFSILLDSNTLCCVYLLNIFFKEYE